MPGNKSNIQTFIDYDYRLVYFKVFSDKIRLKQIMLNLISNSVKFTKSGSISISAKLVTNENSHNLNFPSYDVEILVEDTGIGIKEEYVKLLQEKSTDLIKLNIDESYNEMGSGIGISIIKVITSKLKHEFFIQSELNSGSKFKILIKNILPLDIWSLDSQNIKTLKQDNVSYNLCSVTNKSFTEKESVLDHDKSFREKNKLLSYKFVSDKNLSIQVKQKILICDDCASIVSSISNLIKRNNYLINKFDIVESFDGIESLYQVYQDQIKGNLIKILFIDENMEYLIGSKTIEIIRDLEKHNKIRKIYIISLTAFIDEWNVADIKAKGADMVLFKPLNSAVLGEIIEQFSL